MKKNLFIFMLLLTSATFAQNKYKGNYALGVNYIKTDLMGAEIKLYNVHFEKQKLYDITFGVEGFFMNGEQKKEIQNGFEKISNLYYVGPTILYKGMIHEMFQYKVSLNANLGYIDYEKFVYDMGTVIESIYYGLVGRIEGIAQASLHLQLNFGIGVIKGFSSDDTLELDTNPSYHIGLTYLF